VSSYSILAPNVIPPGFVDGKVASEKVLAALNLGDQYRLGHTKVFFKAGILGQLEEWRDDRLSAILSNFQARIRGYLIRKNYKQLQDQRSVESTRSRSPTTRSGTYGYYRRAFFSTTPRVCQECGWKKWKVCLRNNRERNILTCSLCRQAQLS